MGCGAIHATGPLQLARPPSAQRLNGMQQPTAEHPHVVPGRKTEWQSLRTSHSVCVVTWLQLAEVPASGAKQAMAGQTSPQEPVPGVHPEHHLCPAGQTPASVAHAPS
jgi:hypothetical protein